MELIEIEAFLEVADTGGFTTAAQRLAISQPAISRRIELLERELGSPLFTRGRGGAALTDAGEAFQPFARQAVASLRDGARAIQDLRLGDRGRVTVALVGTLSSTRLTARIRAFRDAYPGIRLSLRTARSDEVSALVLRGEAEIGLRYFADTSPAIDSKWVEDEALCVICAGDTGLIAGDREAVTIEQLRGVPWVSFPIAAGTSGDALARLLRQQLAAHQLDDAEIITIDSLTAQKRLVEADFGLGLVPISSVEEEVRLGTLRKLEIPGINPVSPVYLLRRVGGYLSPAAQAMWRMLGQPATGDNT